MDIPALSMAMAQSEVQTEYGVAMLSKSLDMSEATGAAITDMIDAAAMQRSVNPNIGGNFDTTI
ncbi:MAG: YjfB family protein [Lachnospiraceae bacterium]|nr:YjfB family protein [Lachnospiraceae bacterium]